MEWKEIIFSLRKDKKKQLFIFYYNMRIGLSVFLQKILIAKTNSNLRYFYCNVNYLYLEYSKHKLKKYFFFLFIKIIFIE